MTRNKKQRGELDTPAFFKEVADRMFIPEDTVQAIWDISAAIIIEALVSNEKVTIKNFGVFKISKSGAARFRASTSLRQLLRETKMEKFGVEMNNEAVLMAKITGECPTCKGILASKDPPQCPKCGTAPFEKQRKPAPVKVNSNEEI